MVVAHQTLSYEAVVARIGAFGDVVDIPGIDESLAFEQSIRASSCFEHVAVVSGPCYLRI